jgi:hypothetical protein
VKHPAFPVPSFPDGTTLQHSSGKILPRECEVVSRHCERSEAIHIASAEAFWIASSLTLLAMTTAWLFENRIWI